MTRAQSTHENRWRIQGRDGSGRVVVEVQLCSRAVAAMVLADLALSHDGVGFELQHRDAGESQFRKVGAP